MPLIITCAVLLAMGVVVTIIWWRERFVAPLTPFTRPSGSDGSNSGSLRHVDGLRLYAWWAAVFIVIGTATGILITGAGGRLVMRLLALMSPEATGRLTEGQAAVGEISLEGTLAFALFGALPFAFASAALYLLVVPWLPRGALGGLLLGAVMFITVSPFVDPLRAENFDFDIVGPGWLAVVAFALLALLQGAALSAIAGRLSRSLQLMTRRNWPQTVVPLLLAVVLFPIGAVLAVGALVTFALPRLLPWFLVVRASRTGVVVGRVLLAVAVVAALPAFAGAVVSIWGR